MKANWGRLMEKPGRAQGGSGADSKLYWLSALTSTLMYMLPCIPGYLRQLSTLLGVLMGKSVYTPGQLLKCEVSPLPNVWLGL